MGNKIQKTKIVFARKQSENQYSNGWWRDLQRDVHLDCKSAQRLMTSWLFELRRPVSLRNNLMEIIFAFQYNFYIWSGNLPIIVINGINHTDVYNMKYEDFETLIYNGIQWRYWYILSLNFPFSNSTSNQLEIESFQFFNILTAFTNLLTYRFN